MSALQSSRGIMRRPSWWIGYSVLAVALILALVGPARAATPDAWITTKIKLALLTTDGVSGTAIKVDTVLGQVTLYGKVHSAEERAKAETVARKVDGVQGVRNLLQVVAPAHEAAMQVSDDALKQRVEQALEADPSLKSSSIAVQSVNQGVVLLSGTAKTLSAHLRAVEVAAAVPGVHRVASEIQSPDTLADAEIWRAPAPQHAKAGYGVWDSANDIWITSAVRMRLIADTQVPGLEIDLDSYDGVVTLFGMVSSHEAKAAAEADALKVSGVKRVVNELQVVASSRQEAVSARDDDLQREVRTALDEHAFRDVRLEVRNGVVRLTGHVPTGAQSLQAAVLARSVPGVRAVENDLRLR
jgi:hyperosmotically inducible periplasmic protein